MLNKSLGTALTVGSMQTGTLVTGLLLVLGSLFFKSLPVTLGVLAGGLLACGNFIVIRTVVVKITSEATQSKTIPAAVAVLKFVLMAGVIYAALSSKYIDPVGFLVGLSSVVITIVVMPLGRTVCDAFSRVGKR